MDTQFLFRVMVFKRRVGIGLQDDSLVKGTGYQAWQPEFRPPEPRGGREELTPQSCPLTSDVARM